MQYIIALFVLVYIIRSILESIPTWVYVTVGVLIAIPVIYYLINKKEIDEAERTRNEERERNRQYRLQVAVEKHIDTLVTRRRQYRVDDGYGTIDDAKWQAEIQKFTDSALGDVRPLWKNNELSDLFNSVERLVKSADNSRKYTQREFKSSMTGHQYEHFCADRLSRLGWNARVTQASGDQGVDIVASKNGRKIAIQCKKYDNPVGNKAVQEAHAGMGHIRADAAAVIVSSSFTPSAKKLASTLGVQLLHHDELGKLA